MLADVASVSGVPTTVLSTGVIPKHLSPIGEVANANRIIYYRLIQFTSSQPSMALVTGFIASDLYASQRQNKELGEVTTR